MVVLFFYARRTVPVAHFMPEEPSPWRISCQENRPRGVFCARRTVPVAHVAHFVHEINYKKATTVV